jgi:hypothetical protein
MSDVDAQNKPQDNPKADGQSPAEGLRQQILDRVQDAQAGIDDDDIKLSLAKLATKEIMEFVIAYAATVEREVIERIRKWTEYNKHDMGEMGEFIRTQYVYNKLDDELARLVALQGPQDDQTKD